MGSEKYQLLARTFKGLEDVLKNELEEIGATDLEVVERGVTFFGSKEVMYKANFCCRTALRIQRILGYYKAKNASDLYHSVYKIDWTEIFNIDQSFTIICNVDSEAFNNSTLISLRAKDAIVDQYKAKSGKRPSFNTDNPDIFLLINATIDGFTIAIESSGELLSKRGYRVGNNENAMNEVLAAGILKIAGWKGQCDLYDPMCGSGTIAIEAALMARNIQPGIFRKSFAFEKWKDFDADLFEKVYNEDDEVVFAHKIYASDILSLNVKITERNAKSAGLKNEIEFNTIDFSQLTQVNTGSVVILDPPASDRKSERRIEPVYSLIGDTLKKNFGGSKAWLFSGGDDSSKNIGLKPNNTVVVFNGGIESSLREYELFNGMHSFNKENNAIRNDGFDRRERTNYGERKEGFNREGKGEFIGNRRSGDKPFARKSETQRGERPQGGFNTSRNDRSTGGFRNSNNNGFKNNNDSRNDRQNSGFGKERRSGDRKQSEFNNDRRGAQRPENFSKPKTDFIAQRPIKDNRVEILSTELLHPDKKGVYQPKENSNRVNSDNDSGKAKRKRINKKN